MAKNDTIFADVFPNPRQNKMKKNGLGFVFLMLNLMITLQLI